MNNNIVIGISGKKMSGKSTVAEIIKNIYPNTLIFNFGDAVKESLKPIFDFTDEELYGKDKEKINEYWNITPREIMQFYATELMRIELSKKFKEIGTDLWVKCVEKKIIKALNENKNCIILLADVRFKNEYEFVKKYNGITLNIIRQTNNLHNQFENHKSENDLQNENFDFTIFNNGGMINLRMSTYEFLHDLNIEIPE